MPPDGRSSLHERIGATPEQVRAAHLRMMRFLTNGGVPDTAHSAAEVVLAEIMNNIVEHAYQGLGSGQIDIRIDISENALAVRVEDTGRPMPELGPPENRRHDLDVDLSDLPEGGFGWFLIGELTGDLEYRRSEDRNHLRFCIPFAPRA